MTDPKKTTCTNRAFSAIWDFLIQIHDLEAENAALRKQVEGHAERIAAQSEILSRAAETPLTRERVVAAAIEDDTIPITDDWLETIRFSESGLKGMTILLPPRGDEAIAELCIAGDENGWTACLIQGVPDDPRVADDMVALTALPLNLTRGHVRRLLAALKGE